MKLNDLYAITDEVAPKRLSDEYCATYGAYDNSGVLVNVGEDIVKAVFSLDLSMAAIKRAIDEKANVIVTHHPAIYGKIGELNVDKNRLEEKLVICIKKGISVLSMHLNLDGAEGGIDESLMQGVALAAGGNEPSGISVQHPLTGGGYGRAYDIKEITVEELAKAMGKEFSTERVLCYGKEKTVKRVASFCGAGTDESAVAFAKKQGADVIVSAEFKHHVIALALEEGLSVIALTHYASEQYGFEKFYKKICQRVEIPCVLHVDETLL